MSKHVRHGCWEAVFFIRVYDMNSSESDKLVSLSLIERNGFSTIGARREGIQDLQYRRGRGDPRQQGISAGVFRDGKKLPLKACRSAWRMAESFVASLSWQYSIFRQSSGIQCKWEGGTKRTERTTFPNHHAEVWLVSHFRLL